MKKKLLLLILLISLQSFSQCYGELSVGGNHVTTIKPNGTLWGWGYAEYGQLGNTSWYEPLPIQLGTSNDWAKVTNGVGNTFVIKNNGTLWGTGNNEYGCLGVGSTAILFTSFQQITTATNWAKIAPSYFFTIALKTDGTIWGWGQNDFFQVIGGTVANQLNPVQIGTDTDWVDVETTSSRTSFALKSNGTVWGWGANTGLLLGISSISSFSTPTQLNSATDWAKLAAGGASHILALKTNGTLWVWGNGSYGQLGNNTTNSTSIPLQIGSDTWIHISSGTQTCFGIKSNGTLWSWGRNNYGQLGQGSTTDLLVPTQIGTDTNWATVDTKNFNFTVATKTDGSVWAWGDNYFGEFGNGTTTASSVPVLISSICVLDTPEIAAPKQITLYPNPTKDNITLEIKKSGYYELYSLNGSILRKGKLDAGENQISLQSLATGYYLIKVSDEEGNSNYEKICKI